ncbi:MAG: hypothetical protein ABUL58_03685, partial [Steroidobacter sp.]
MKSRTIWTVLAVFISIFTHQQSFAEEGNKDNAVEDSRLTLERIECRGNKNIPCDFIRQKLRLQLNHPLVDAEVQNARLRLSALSKFKSVDLHLERGSKKGRVILVVEVIEASALLTESSAEVNYYNVNVHYTTQHSEEVDGIVSGRLSYQNLFQHQKIGELTISGERYSSNEYFSAIDNSAIRDNDN